MTLLARQLEVIEAVMKWDPPVFFFGGFSEDALLHGRASRPHEDVDVVVFRDELESRIEQARALGFEEWHVRLAAVRGRPLVIASVQDDVMLEYSVFERDADGRVHWEKPTPEGTARLHFPDDAFDTPPSRIEGVPIRTLSPLALYHIRAGVTDLFGGMRPKDEVSQAALKRRFFAGVPEAQLAPRIEPPAGGHAARTRPARATRRKTAHARAEDA